MLDISSDETRLNGWTETYFKSLDHFLVFLGIYILCLFSTKLIMGHKLMIEINEV